MKAPGSVLLLLLVLIGACATSVTQELSGPDPEENQSDGGARAGSAGGSAFGGTRASGGATSKAGSSSTAGKASGGAASGGGGGEPEGDAGRASGGQATAGAGGKSSAGSGGQASAGVGGTASGGAVGTGDCDGVAAFAVGAPTKYALNAKVVATCTVGTPCTLEQPPLQVGKTYEFNCTDPFNCGGQDPGTTNWAQPPWKVTRACNP